MWGEIEEISKKTEEYGERHNLSGKKRDELYTVTLFLKNAKINFLLILENIDTNPDEPADIFVKDINKKFQIRWADGGWFSKEAKVKPGELINVSTTRDKAFQDYFWRPLFAKAKYRKSANGIIYLIRPLFNPPWLKDLETLITSIRGNIFYQDFKNLGFNEIFLVCSNENIQIYP